RFMRSHCSAGRRCCPRNAFTVAGCRGITTPSWIRPTSGFSRGSSPERCSGTRAVERSPRCALTSVASAVSVLLHSMRQVLSERDVIHHEPSYHTAVVHVDRPEPGGETRSGRFAHRG